MEWIGYKCGENDISYDHSIADTPFGRFLITWKSWKECPSYDLDESPFSDHIFIYEDSLKDAQAACERMFDDAILSIANPTPASDNP